MNSVVVGVVVSQGVLAFAFVLHLLWHKSGGE